MQNRKKEVIFPVARGVDLEAGFKFNILKKAQTFLTTVFFYAKDK